MKADRHVASASQFMTAVKYQKSCGMLARAASGRGTMRPLNVAVVDWAWALKQQVSIKHKDRITFLVNIIFSFGTRLEFARIGEARIP